VLPVVSAWLLMGTCLTAAEDSALANPYDDPVLRTARNWLYTARGQSIRILEEAVRGSPDNVDYWADLVHTLGVDGQYAFADRAAREGLDRHPDHPLLIYAWAKSKLWRWPEAALDIISRLEKVPGQTQQAQRCREWIQLHVHFPWRLEAQLPEVQSGFYLGWGRKLLDVGKTDRALAILREGLPQQPDDPELLAHLALALAIKGQLTESMRVQKSAGFYQVKYAEVIKPQRTETQSPLSSRSFRSAGRTRPIRAPLRQTHCRSRSPRKRRRIWQPFPTPRRTWRSGAASVLLIEVVTSSIAPASWNSVGGPASIAGGLRGTLDVRQTYGNHLKIERLLTALRAAR
jgi:hypothetical protein